MKKPNTNNTESFIRLKCFLMYKNGSSLQEIATHCHISKEHASDKISAYINHDMLNDKLLQNEHMLNRMNRSSDHVKEMVEQAEQDEAHIDKAIKNGYGFKHQELSEPQHISWFTKCCIHVHSFLFFWK